MNIIKIYLSIVILMWTFEISAQKVAYKIYCKGKLVNYEEMLRNTAEANIIFFGELHNNPIAHWLELELTKDLYALKKEKLILGAEMFESDNQMILDEYLKGLITKAKFEDECRLWNNYKTDYKPIVEFAKENEISMIATNIPRRYASMVNNGGLKSLDQLSKQAKEMICPLPFRVNLKQPTYKALLDDSIRPSQESINFVFAQAIKDATMAHFIVQNLKKGNTFLHFNGSYHSNYKEGIITYLLNDKKNLTVVNITVVLSDLADLPMQEDIEMADIVIVVPSNMTTTY